MAFQVEVLGNFSIGKDSEYLDDLSGRRFFVQPDDDNFDFDVVQGLEDILNDHDHQATSKIRRIDLLLQWIRLHKDELVERNILKNEGTSRKLEIDFVGRRCHFSDLLRASNSLYQFDILVTLCNGTYYLEHYVDHDKPFFEQEFYLAYRASIKKNLYYRKRFAEYVTNGKFNLTRNPFLHAKSGEVLTPPANIGL